MEEVQIVDVDSNGSSRFFRSVAAAAAAGFEEIEALRKEGDRKGGLRQKSSFR